MATGFSRTLEGGHDVIYDYCCTICEGENLNAEALCYCKDCSHLFCVPCKKSHDKFFRTHQVLGRKEVAKWGEVKPVVSSLMCDEHSGEKLNLFCEDHDRLCCPTCISLKHRRCKDVKPVSDVAKGIQKKSEFKSHLCKAPKTQSKLKSLHDKQENNIKILQKARGEITSTFRKMRKNFNEIIDRLEEDSTTELDRLLTILQEQVTSDKDTCLDIQNKIQKLLDDIQTLGKQCDELAFQGYKKCSEQMARADKLLSSMQYVDYQIKFIPDVKIEQYLSSLETLGSFNITPSGSVDRMKNDEVAQTMNPPDHVYSVVNKQTYNVETSGDTNTCTISGMCKLPDKRIAIVNQPNCKIKLLSAASYCVQDVLELPPYPQDICHTTGTELAVTVCKEEDDEVIRKEIQFINAENGKLSHTRTIQLDHECIGIAYHNAQLYLGSFDALYVNNMSGKKIKKLYEHTSGEYPNVWRFSLSDDGSMIYVTNPDKHLLITLDSSGQQLSTFSDPELQYPTGVCVADNGSVFVCGWDSNTILQVDREGKRKMTTLFTKDDGVYKPACLCYDRKTHTLLVGQEDDDNLLALQLK